MKILIAAAALMPAAAQAAPLPRPASFAVCGACHKAEAGAPNGIGPNLWGIGRRLSGMAPGYASSPALKAAKIKWTRKELIAFIADPQKRVPGNKMPYAGEKNPVRDAQIADYLLSLK